VSLLSGQNAVWRNTLPGEPTWCGARKSCGARALTGFDVVWGAKVVWGTSDAFDKSLSAEEVINFAAAADSLRIRRFI
jgi:hypothetical protein